MLAGPTLVQQKVGWLVVVAVAVVIGVVVVGEAGAGPPPPLQAAIRSGVRRGASIALARSAVKERDFTIRLSQKSFGVTAGTMGRGHRPGVTAGAKPPSQERQTGITRQKKRAAGAEGGTARP
jgi:hypothetical protein